MKTHTMKNQIRVLFALVAVLAIGLVCCLTWNLLLRGAVADMETLQRRHLNLTEKIVDDEAERWQALMELLRAQEASRPKVSGNQNGWL